MKIPFINLSKQTQQIWDELNPIWERIIKKGQFINGPEVEAFESDFASYCTMPNAVGISNGTDALILSLLGLGIEKGDIVITVPNTFIATTEAISAVGGNIEFVDVDPETILMAPQKLSELLDRLKIQGKKAKAVIPVHLFGQMCDMEAIAEIARCEGLKIIEDSSQAHGATHKGQASGFYGDIATFSFYPGKNLGAFGDAGAIVTQNEKLAKWIKMAANHGRQEKYTHTFEGRNNRLDTIQAAVLLVKLKYLEEWTEKRIANAGKYDNMFSKSSVTAPVRREYNRHVFHLYVVHYAKRDEWQTDLREKGIATGIHYPIPLHLQPAYQYLGFSEGDFPVAEMLAKEIISLPIDDEILTFSDLPVLQAQGSDPAKRSSYSHLTQGRDLLLSPVSL